MFPKRFASQLAALSYSSQVGACDSIITGSRQITISEMVSKQNAAAARELTACICSCKLTESNPVELCYC